MEEPAREANVPALQGLHWERALAPRADEAVPGGQEMQPLEVSPMEGLKVPLGHGWQAAAEIEAGRLLKVPTGQGVQEDRPGASAYVPALQRWQETLPAVEAALPKAHAVQLVAPAPLNVPGAHSVDAEEEGPLKEPAGACVQLEEPTSAEKVPARQGTQAERGCT